MSGEAPTREHEDVGLRVERFRLFVLMHVTIVALSWTGRRTDFDPALAWRLLLAGGLLGCALAAWRSLAARRAATWVALGLVAVQVCWRFPETSNHGFLGLLTLAVLVIGDGPEARDKALVFSGLKALMVTVCVWAGLNKAFYGTYFTGEFLAWQMADEVRFARGLGWLLGAAELERLMSIPRRVVGAGPFGFESVLGLALSNLAWLGEVALPALFYAAWPRVRKWAVLALLALVLGIELVAREWLFGGIFARLTLLHWPQALPRWVDKAFVVFYGVVTVWIGVKGYRLWL